MQGWKDCPKCRGNGWASIRGGFKTCHEDPTDEPYVVLGQTVLTKTEANKMVGG